MINTIVCKEGASNVGRGSQKWIEGRRSEADSKAPWKDLERGQKTKISVPEKGPACYVP